MEHRKLTGARLRSAGYDPRQQRLEILFGDRSMRVYKGVPDEVWRRLLASPNPGSYFDDRIAEEYPSEPASPGGAEQARSRLDDLFGGTAPPPGPKT
ncbi:MAG TPA: KTSC domain-containing protein [Burkholderiaceae bacterium]|nr:KTSC domain-containing protein [Burkholderiaceae bacterium]